MTSRQESVFKHFSSKATWHTAPTAEAIILSEAVAMAEMLGAVVVRVEASKKGISDLLMCYRGQFIACELKDDKGTASVHQVQFITNVQKAGGRGAVCRTLKQVFCLITEITFGYISGNNK